MMRTELFLVLSDVSASTLDKFSVGLETLTGEEKRIN